MKERTSIERRLFITSLNADPQAIAGAVRSHWSIENSLHWVLDVTFGEDRSRTRRGNAPENLAALRRWSHSMIKSAEPNSKKTVRQRRIRAALNSDYLLKLIGANLDA